MDPIELTAALLGFASVWLTVRQHISCWPTGLAMVTLYIYVFFRQGYYCSMLLQVVFIFVQVFGWYLWSQGGPRQPQLVVHRLPARHVLPWLGLCVAGTGTLGGIMRDVPGVSFPFLDAFIAVTSLIAQWLMARKVLESWLAWIVVDVVSIGLYAANGLIPTAALYTLLLGLAIWGWFEWSIAWRSTATA